METTHRLNQFSEKLGVVKPKKEVHIQSRNQGIFLQFQQIFVNYGPMRLELVAVAVGPDFFFRLRPDQQLVTAKTYLFTFGIVLGLQTQP